MLSSGLHRPHGTQTCMQAKMAHVWAGDVTASFDRVVVSMCEVLGSISALYKLGMLVGICL